MTAAAVLETGIEHLFVATGASWRRDGIGRGQWRPIPGHDLPHVFTPDDIFAGRLPSGAATDAAGVVVYDNDHYYLGGVIAEKLVQEGKSVILVTPAPLVSIWTENTLEQEKIQARLMDMGVNLMAQQRLLSIQKQTVTLSHAVSGGYAEIACSDVVLLGDRLPNDSLYQDLKPFAESGHLKTLRVLGDADAPNIIERAVFAGHLAAREFEEAIPDGKMRFKVERTALP
jgi:dimethylamine/trimethylamine dehydrogenase